jgi:hypothetical protein
MFPFMLPYFMTHAGARRQRFGEDNDAFNFGADALYGADGDVLGYTPDGQPVLRPRRPMPPWAGHRCGPARAELGADDDVLGADDLDELGAIDAEIMGADDGDDDDDDDVIGGTKKVTHKIKDLEQTLAKLQRRYANTPPTRTQKRKHLQERIAHVQMLLSQKRRTKAQIAREAGLQPLADALLADPTLVPESEAEKYFNAEAGFAGSFHRAGGVEADDVFNLPFDFFRFGRRQVDLI